MPKAKQPQASAAELAARSRTLKHNPELASAYGITPGADAPRETVKVESLPDPPGTEMMSLTQDARSKAPVRNLEEAALHIIAEEMDELGTRLANFGINFPPNMKQEMVDHCMAMIGGGFLAGGGAIARR